MQSSRIRPKTKKAITPKSFQHTEFGNFLAFLRHKVNKSLLEVAREANIGTHQALGAIESGRNPLPWTKFKSLAFALNMPPQFLVDSYVGILRKRLEAEIQAEEE